MSARLIAKEEGLKKYKDMGEFMKCELIDEKADDVFSEYTLGPTFHRLLPRPARALDQATEGFQASLHFRRLLEGRREEPPDAAHLRHCVLLAQRTGRVPQAARRGEEARSPQARPGARSVQHPGTRRTGTHLLSSEGRHRPQDHRRLDARPVPRARLLARLHAARRALGSLEDLRPLQFLRRKHVQTRWSWTMPNTSSSR